MNSTQADRCKQGREREREKPEQTHVASLGRLGKHRDHDSMLPKQNNRNKRVVLSWSSWMSPVPSPSGFSFFFYLSVLCGCTNHTLCFRGGSSAYSSQTGHTWVPEVITPPVSELVICRSLLRLEEDVHLMPDC